MSPALEKTLIITIPFIALFLGALTYIQFQKYTPAKAPASGTVEGTETLDIKYPEAYTISETDLKDSISITQKTGDSPDKILTYYSKALPTNGWESFGPAIYKKGTETITFTMTKDTDNSTILNIDHYLTAIIP